MEDPRRFYQIAKNAGREDMRHTDNLSMHSLIQKETFASILEIGCGNGEMLDFYQGIKSCGIDINPEMVRYAKEQGRDIKLEDITSLKSKFLRENRCGFERIVSNYVLTELTIPELHLAFENMKNLLQDKGKIYFCITNPKVSGRNDLPGYITQFEEEYIYEKEDLEFKVLLEDEKGNFEDVGIIDYHRPIQKYVDLCSEYFSKCKIHFNDKGLGFHHSLIFELEK